MMRSLFLVLILTFPLGAFAAEEHLVPAAELEQEVAERAADRERDLATVDGLFERSETVRTIEQAGFDPEQVREAVPLLDDETLAELAARAREIDGDVEGGLLGTLVLLLLLAILLVVLLTQLED